MIAGLLLAAGEGRRLGRPKALLEFDGERLVDRALRMLREGGCDPVYAVSGAVQLEDVDAVVVANPRWRTGMGSSLRAGLAAMPDEASAVVVALVDQPQLGPEAVRRLVAAHAAGAVVAVATYAGRRGNPVLLGRSTWDEVTELAQDDVGARPFLAAHPELVTPVPCDGAGDPADVDNPEDLTRLLGSLTRRPD